MKFFIILTLCVVAACGSLESDKSWTEFTGKHKKSYKNKDHEAVAKEHFGRNLKRVQAHNLEKKAGKVSYEMDVYDFSDVSVEEAKSVRCGTILAPSARALPQQSQTAASFPTGAVSKDWRASTLPVADQGGCGSCWAFAAMAQVESMYKRKNSAFNTPLSQQYLVDCNIVGNNGCNGGWPTTALNYIKAKSSVTNALYPYTGVQATCQTVATITSPANPVMRVVQYDLNGDETQLKNIISQDGPIAVAVDVTNNFMNYKTGVFEDTTCSSTCLSINHAVLVVGYGTDTSYSPPKDYWLVRNSWGSLWGEQGHIRMARNKANNCNTACYAMYTKCS